MPEPISSINGNPIVVGASGITDGTVTDSKLDANGIRYSLGTMREPTRNLNTGGVGAYFAGTSTGNIVPDEGYGTHAGMPYKVPCEAETMYWVTKYDLAGTFYFCFYDEDGEFLGHVTGTSNSSAQKVTTPASCAFLYVFVYRGAGVTITDSSRIMVEARAGCIEGAGFVEPFGAVDLGARGRLDSNDALVDQLTVRTRNINDLPVGRYRVQAPSNEGVIQVVTDGSTTTFGIGGYLPCEPSTTYTVTLFDCTTPGQILVGEYDEGCVVIQRETQSNNSKVATFTTTADTRYMAVQAYKSTGITLTDSSRIQVEVGSESTPYVPPRVLRAADAAADVPYYWLNELSDSIASVKANMTGVGRDGDTFVFVTDVHWRRNKQHSPALIRYILDNTNVRMVINGGDNIDGHLTTRTGAIDEIMAGVNAMRFDGPGMVNLGVFGNHDNNRNNNSVTESYLSEDDQFDLINRAYGTVPNVTYGDEGNYYWYDNPICKVRYLMLDWQANSTKQSAFIADALSSMGEGWAAVVVIHGIYKLTSGDETHTPVMERQYVLDACEPYKDDILFFIQGHTHWDFVLDAYESGTPIIVTSCDTCSENAGAVAGTTTEQCFDVVTFDRSAGTAKLVRVGRGSDRTVTL